MSFTLIFKSSDEIPLDTGFLDANEYTRYKRLLTPEKKNEFLKGRIFIKQTLAPYISTPAQKVSLSVSPTGRPFLSIIYGPNSPFFSLSHTQGYYALGISRLYPIGIDMELNRPLKLESLKLFFSQNEFTQLQEQKINKQQKLLELFVKKEAFIKATDKKWGLNEINFSLQNDTWSLEYPLGSFAFFQEKIRNFTIGVCLHWGSEILK